MKSLWVGLSLGGLTLSCLGCSFVSERPPPEVPTHYAKGEKPCAPDNIWNPIADTASVAASVTWVVWANQKIDQAENDANAARALDPADSHNPDDSSYKWARAGGYAAIGLFAASAIYGFITEAKCADYRQQRDPSRSPLAGDAQAPGRAHGFPTSVLDFSWDADAQRAAQICRARAQEWFLEGSVGLCQTQTASAAHPDVRLEFELGHPARIVVIYRSAPQTMNENYTQLFAALRKTYGAPQTQPAHVSAACASSLAQCLAGGEHPTGPVWSWDKGTIELAPVWQEDHALLELRYVRTDASAQ